MTAKSRKQIKEIINQLPDHIKVEPRIQRDVAIYVLTQNKEYSWLELAVMHGVSTQSIYNSRIRFLSKIKPLMGGENK